ncbi:MAG: CsbD family protein [Hyphomicrobiaceae bacterium]|nr:CsbD family protein [Hyphomicrobiaceae bacterium]
MNSLRIKGAALKLKGSIKEAVGRLTGDERLEASGELDKVVGSVRTAMGTTQDAVRDSIKPN